MAHATSVFHVQVELELTHAAPASGQAVTRCCDKTPFELKRTDRITNDMSAVTCPAAWLKRPNNCIA